MDNPAKRPLSPKLRRKASDLRSSVDQVLRDRLATVDNKNEARQEIHAQAAVLRYMLGVVSLRASEPLDPSTVVVRTEHLSQDGE